MSPWEPGVIKGHRLQERQEAATDSIKTAGAPAKLMLKPDRTTLYADGNDASSIEVDIEDADGNPIFRRPPITVEFAMTGPGRSLGHCQRRLEEQRAFQGNQPESHYQGKALVVIFNQTTVPGTINLTVSSEGLDSSPSDLEPPKSSI